MSEDDLASIKADLALFAGDGTGDTLTPDEVKAIFTMETGDGTPFSEDELAKFTSVILAKCPVDADGTSQDRLRKGKSSRLLSTKSCTFFRVVLQPHVARA